MLFRSVAGYSSTETLASETNGNWANRFDSSRVESATPFGNPVARPDRNYYQINNAEDLALLSYLVATETGTTWASANYELTANIDLAGSYWTPIGSPSNGNFMGVFNGNFHTVSGMVVSESSAGTSSDGLTTTTYLAGLFGCTFNATICNVTCSEPRFNGTGPSISGSIVAMSSFNTTVINCSGSIGETTGPTKIYEGAVTAGSTGTLKTVTIKNDKYAATKGFAVMYNLNGGEAYAYSSKTSLGDKKYSSYGTLLTLSGDNASSGLVANYGPSIESRVNVMNGESGVFAIKVGFAFSVDTTLSTLASTGYIASLNWTMKPYNLNAYYGYASDPVRTTLRNDAKFDTNFTRVGYTLEGIYTDATHENRLSGLNFVGDNPALSGNTYTVYLNWTPLTNIGYKIHTLLNGEEHKDSEGNSLTDASQAYSGNLEINDEKATIEPDQTSGVWAVSNHNASKTITITFREKLGFSIGEGDKVGYISESPEVFEEGGVYHVFDSVNVDSKALIASKVSRESKTDENGKLYTECKVEITNLVGSGDVYLVFGRAEIKVELKLGFANDETPTITNTSEGMLLTTSNVKATLSGNSAATKFEVATGKAYLVTKLGEQFTVNFKASKDNQFFATYNVIGCSEFVTGTPTKVTIGEGSYAKEYTVATKPESGFFSTVEGILENQIIAIARALSYKVTIKIEHSNGKTKDYTPPYNELYDGVNRQDQFTNAYAEGSGSNATTSIENYFNADLNESDSSVTVYLYSNEYYKCFYDNGYKGKIKGLNTSDDTEKYFDLTATPNANGFIDYSYSFIPEFVTGGGEFNNAEYIITFTAVPQTYTVSSEIYIDGEKADSDKIEAYGITGQIQNGVARPGDTTGFTFTLAENGQKYLVNTPKLTTEVAQAGDNGSVGEINGGEYTFGTRNTIIRADYTTKKITLNLDATAIVKNVNGSGKDAALGGFTYNKDSLGAIVNYSDFKIALDNDSNDYSINMEIGYYLVGWYLKNGEVVVEAATLEELLNKGGTIAGLLAKEGETLELSVQPVIKQKTITLSFSEGEDEHDLITGTGENQTYYHAQENYEVEGTVKSGFDFSKTAGYFKKIATSGLISWLMTDKNITYLVDATFTYDSSWNDIYGENDNITFNFQPKEWNKIVYTIGVDTTSTISISLGDTIYLTYDLEGNATYHNGEISLGLTKRQGYTANSFSFQGNGNSQTILGNLSGSTNVFTLSEENIITFLASGYYYTKPDVNAFTISTVWEPVVYKVFVDYSAYEQFDWNEENYPLIKKEEGENGRYYIEVAYNSEMTGLAEFKKVLTRLGYTVSGWKNISDSTDENVYNENKKFTLTNDITVKAIWEVDLANPYISINLDGNKDVYYNGKVQTLGTASILPELESGKSYLANGEKVNKGYWVLLGEDNQIIKKFEDNKLILELSNVSESGKYAFVIEVTSDTLSLVSENYTRQSEAITITIKQNEIVIVGSALESYYTGTERFIATENSVQGKLYFNYNAEGKQFSNDLSDAEKIEFEISNELISVVAFRLVSSNGFAVGSNIEIDYILNTNNYENNFTNFKTFGQTGGFTKVSGEYYNNEHNAFSVTEAYFIRHQSENNKIVPTTITFNVSGKGFYVFDMLHKVPFTIGNVQYSIDGSEITVPFDDFTITADIETSSSLAGFYSDLSQFNINYTVKLGGVDVTNNFTANVSGSYEIEDTNASNSYSYNYNVGYLTAKDGMLQSVSNRYGGKNYYNIKITEIVLGDVTLRGEDITEFYTYSNDIEMVITVTGNGTENLNIVIRKGYEVKFTVTVVPIENNVNLSYLGVQSIYIEPADREKLILEFKGGQSLDTEVTEKVSSASYYALFTDVKAITLDKGNGSENEVFFLSAGDNNGKIVVNPEWRGFEFDNWNITKGSGVVLTESADAFVVKAEAGSIPTTLTAQWTLLDPTVTMPQTKEIVKTASETAQTISFTEVAGDITNRNSYITYSYKWYKGDSVIGGQTSENLVLNNITTLNAGDYKLLITATYDGQVKTIEVPFTLKVNTIKITSFELNKTSDTYSNSLISLDANLMLSVGGAKTFNIYENLTDGKIKFGILYKEASVSQIKNAGVYTITLTLDTTIYELAEDVEESQTFVVNKYSYTVKKEEANLSKVFGTVDPALQTTLTLNGQNIIVEFTRGEGEAVDSYPLYFKSVNNENYDIIVPENSDWFEITKTTSNLFVSFNRALTMVYNGKVPASIEAKYENGWKAIVKDMTGAELATVNMTLYFNDAAGNMVMVTTNLSTAFDGFTLSFDESISKNVGTYNLVLDGTSDTYTGIEFTGNNKTLEITKATIIVKDILKTFDETANFVWNSVSSDNITSLTAENLVTGENVTIKGTLGGITVGRYATTQVTLEGEGAGNYNITCTENGQIVASNVEIEVSGTVNEINYGQIKEESLNSPSAMNNLIKLALTANGNSSKAFTANYVSIDSVRINDAQYSKGTFLKVLPENGKYVVVFTLSSANYNKANGEFEVEITINPIAIDLSGNTVTKEYDGEESLPNMVWNMAGKLAGDEVNVTGRYENALIGTNKNLELSLTGLDAENYTISASPRGNITSKAFNFVGKFEYDFVDGLAVPEDIEFAVTYNGNSANFLSSLASKYNSARQGYTQKGWTYDNNGTETNITSDFDAFLDAVVKANATENGAITLNAIWEINKIQVVVNANNASVKYNNAVLPNGGLIEVNYYDNIEISIDGVEGYRYNNYAFSGNGTITEPSNKLTNTTFKLENIITGGTLTINMAEIEISVSIDLSNAPAVANASATWLNKTFVYSVANKVNGVDNNWLPEVTTTLGTYVFDYWTYKVNEEDVRLTDTSTLISALGGNVDKDSGITLTAHFKAAELTISINGDHIKTITINDVEVTNGKFITHYAEDVTIKIVGEAGWKYVRETHEGNVTSITSTEGSVNNLNATLEVTNITSDLTINLVMEEIKVTFKAEKNDANLLNTTITGWTGKTFNYSELNVLVSSLLSSMTATAGTYNQTAWTVGERRVEFTENVLSLIGQLKGEITTDLIIETLLPVWTGENYVITFVSNAEGSTTTGTNPINAIYGEAITGLPTAELEGHVNTWNTEEDGTGLTYREGSKLTTIGALEDGKYNLTLYAQWSTANVEIEIKPNTDNHIISMNIEGEDVTNGSTKTLNFADVLEITVTLEDGYEIDVTRTVLNPNNGQVVVEGNTITISAVTTDAEITVYSKPKTYTISFNVSDYEQINKDEIQVVYGAAAAELSTVTVTREGYDFVEWVDSEGNTYDATTEYKVAGNITLTAKWAVKETKFVSANIGDNFNTTYNGKSQQVANAVLSANGKTISVGESLLSGEKVIKVEYQVKGENDTWTIVSEGMLLNLKDVTNSTYRLLVTIQDLLTSTTYTIYSNEKTVVIEANSIKVSGQNLVSYYTGTNAYVGKEGSNIGTLQYVIGETNVEEISITSVVFEENNFNVGLGYTLRYNLSIHESVVNNYTGLKGNSTEGYYITVENASIVSTPVVINVKGQGYETGKVHTIEDYEVTTSVNGINLNNFNFEISLTTKGTTGKQTEFNEIANSFVVTLNNENVTSNFTHEVTGEYDILSASETYKYDFSINYLTANNGSVELQSKNGYTISISGIKVGDKLINIGEGENFNYIDAETNIFTLAGNNTEKVILVVNNNYDVTFNVTINGVFETVDFLGYTSDITLDSLKTTLENLTQLISKTASFSGRENQEIHAVVTDVKVVTLENGEKDEGLATVYSKIGGEGTSFEVPTWTGFECTGWSIAEGVSVSEGKVVVASNANILPATLTAQWAISKPTTSENNNTISVNAQEGNTDLRVYDIIGAINNQTSDLTYNFAWYNEKGELIGSGETISLKADTDLENNTYYVIVTASKTGFVSASSDEINFTIKVSKATLTVTTTSTDVYTYKNKNYADEITFTLNGTIQKTLTELLATGDVHMVINNGEGEVTEIKNAGTYNVSVIVNEKIYNAFNKVFTFTVNKDSYIIKESDVSSLWKYYGEEEPELKVTISLNNENIDVYFTREAGESVGNYKLSIDTAKTNYSNYSISIDEDNEYFEIRKTEGVLKVTLNGEFKKTYDKNEVELRVEFDEASKTWKLVAYNKGEDTPITQIDLTLKVYNNGTLSDIALSEIASALRGVSFTLKNSSVNAKAYEILINADDTANYKNVSFDKVSYFTIEKKNILVESVTKVFDKTSTFVDTDVIYDRNQIISGDIITISGAFDDERVGDKTVEFVIDGADKDNYEILRSSTFKATITPSYESIKVDVTNTEFTYGDITQGLDEDQLLALLGSITITVGENYTSALTDGYLTIKSVVLNGGLYSSSLHLKANGNYTITVTLASNEYANANNYEKEVKITVATINLDLSATVVEKVYDNTFNVVNATWDLSKVLAGDKVSVSAAYLDKQVGINKDLNVELTGMDSGNYAISASPKGSITATSVRLLLDNDSLGEFVDDGKEIYSSKTYVDVSYPNLDGAGVIKLLTMPTREGYHVTNWAYEVSEGVYEDISETNIIAVLDKAYENGKTLTIYAEWEINDVVITITSTNGDITSGVESGVSYTIKYYDDITFSVMGNVGYKFDNIKVTAGTVAGEITKSGVGTRRDGEFTLKNVASNLELTVSYLEINITVNIDKNIRDNTEEVGNAWTKNTFVYSHAEGVNDILPQIEVLSGTYTQSKWVATINGKTVDVEMTDTRLLKELVGEEVNSDEDAVITFKAEWQGVDYTINFDKNDEDAVMTGNSTITVKYGESLANKTFPTASKTGMKNTWNTKAEGSGRYYTNEDIFETRDEINESGFNITLYAIWANENYNFTVEIAQENVISVMVGGEEVESGKEFTLKYGSSISFVVEVREGYLIACNESELDGFAVVSKLGKTLTISNLSKDNIVFKIFAEAQENTMKVNANLSSLASVIVGEEEVTVTDNTFKVKTGEQAVLTFNASEGYTFDENSVVIANGGIVTKSINEGVLTLTWTGFTTNSTLTVTASAKANTVTIKDSSKYVNSLYINSRLLPASGATYEALTGSELTVSVLLKYGYKNATISLVNDYDNEIVIDGIIISKIGEEIWDESAKAYKQIFSITGFIDGFNIKVSATEREYQFEISTNNIAMGSVSPENATLNFGESLELSATTNTGFAFVGWYIGEKAISYSSDYTFVLNEANKVYLESGEVISVVGHFDYSQAEFSISAKGKGSLSYKIGDGADITVNANSTSKNIISFNTLLTISTLPNRGYAVEFKFYGVDDEEMSYSDYTFENGVLSIYARADGPRHIEVSFVPQKATIKVDAGVQINYQMSYGTDIGGTIKWADENGNLKNESDYIHEGNIAGVSYTINTATGNKEYFVVEPNSGFSFTMASKNAGVIINRLEKDGKIVFEVDGIVGNIELEAVFKAKDNNIDVYFEDENNNKVLAGKITVSTNGYVIASGNDSSYVKINALTGEDVNLVVYTNLTFSFDEGRDNIYTASDDIKNKITLGEVSDAEFALGYTSKVNVTITNIDNNGYIVFHVKPKTFNLQFVNEHEQYGPVLENVSYGYDIPAFNPDEIIPQSKDGYLFKGYFTKELGQGRQYFGEHGQIVSKWFETGYEWNGIEYEVAPHYDPNTNTFTLYAAWYYSKERITIDFIPDELKNTAEGIRIGDIVTPRNNSTTIWTNADNVFYAEVKAGEEMLITAYKFKGYAFQYWYIDRGNGDVLRITGETYPYTSENGEVIITAVYKAEFSLEVFDETTQELSDICGEAYLDNIGNTNGLYDTEAPVTIYAVENKGYKFKGWFNTVTNDYLRDENGNILLGQKDGKKYSYTFESQEPIYLRAIFEGSTVSISVADFANNGNIEKVELNGIVIDKTQWSSFEAKIGDRLTITLTVKNGYGVKWDGPTFTGGNGVYNYIVNALDLVSDEQEIILIRPVADPSPLKFLVKATVQGKDYQQTKELDDAAKITFKDSYVKIVEINSLKTINTLYGVPVYIDISINPNYKLGGVYINKSGKLIPLENVYFESQRQIVINTSQIEEYLIGNTLQLTIDVIRRVWTSEEYRGKTLQGEGIEENPYIIASAEDLAFMAYLVNNGIIDEITGRPFTDGYYSLTSDINLIGNYWEPIGNESHAFNGVLNLNSFKITGISLCPYEKYLPRTYYDGLFWCMTGAAKVIQTNNTLTIALIAAGGTLLLLLLLLLILLLVRRRKKKRMDELANS